MSFDQQVRDRLHEATRRFPEGCRVRRLRDAPGTQSNCLAEAVVSRVVMTGIHGDTFLKIGDGFGAKFLDPDWYEVIDA